jgi:hypothetical protein
LRIMAASLVQIKSREAVTVPEASSPARGLRLGSVP